MIAFSPAHFIESQAHCGVMVAVANGDLRLIPLAGAGLDWTAVQVAQDHHADLVAFLLAPVPISRQRALDANDEIVLRVLAANPDTDHNLLAYLLRLPRGRIDSIASCVEGRQFIEDLRHPDCYPLIAGLEYTDLPGVAIYPVPHEAKRWLSDTTRERGWFSADLLGALHAEDHSLSFGWPAVEGAARQLGFSVKHDDEGGLFWLHPAYIGA